MCFGETSCIANLSLQCSAQGIPEIPAKTFAAIYSMKEVKDLHSLSWKRALQVQLLNFQRKKDVYFGISWDLQKLKYYRNKQ